MELGWELLRSHVGVSGLGERVLHHAHHVRVEVHFGVDVGTVFTFAIHSEFALDCRVDEHASFA